MKYAEKAFHRLIDFIYTHIPQPKPAKARLQQAQIISHRGEHDNRAVFENTLPAFDAALAAGVWGIEFDLRWTRDLQPIVLHDHNFERVFNSSASLNGLTLAQVKTRFPLVPTLAEVIARYGKKMHLMLEIKAEIYPDPAHQNRVLENILAPLTPQTDYHLITLSAPMFTIIEFASPQTMLPIAQLNVDQVSRLALAHGYGGMLGHYFFLSAKRIENHRQKGQQIGTGYAKSFNCLLREVNREVTWIFSNNAVELQKCIATRA